MSDHSYKRHIAKAVTWRFIGTLDTITLSWIISGDPFAALKIGFSEVATKMILYYLHERIWFKVKLGKSGEHISSRKRHLAKSVTWRLTGTLDTMTIAWIVTGNPLTGLQIGGVEVFTKMVLYYMHERFWYRINFGLDNRKKEE